MLKIAKVKNLKSAAQFTLDNMQIYYEMYDVNWIIDDVYQATKALDNFDILMNNELIGVLRLSFDNKICQLRDIQIGTAYQGKGYGAQVIDFVKAMATERACQAIELKVFQRSPAHKLYSRVGFTTNKQDERFYYMTMPLA